MMMTSLVIPVSLKESTSKDKTIFQNEWKNLLSYLSNLEISSLLVTNKKKKVYTAYLKFFNGNSEQYKD